MKARKNKIIFSFILFINFFCHFFFISSLISGEPPKKNSYLSANKNFKFLNLQSTALVEGFKQNQYLGNKPDKSLRLASFRLPSIFKVYNEKVVYERTLFSQLPNIRSFTFSESLKNEKSENLKSQNYDLPTSTISSEKVKGVWYLFSEKNIPSFEILKNDIEKFKEVGFNTIFLPAHVYQHNVLSNEVFLPSREYLEGIISVINFIKKSSLNPFFYDGDSSEIEPSIKGGLQHKNLQCALTVFLLVKDGSWRGVIMPTDRTKWFKSYENAVVEYAKIAQQSGIDFFAIGSELETIKNENQLWETVIENVRKNYSGKIIYNTNWWYNEEKFNDIYEKMEWLNGVDYIGISAYFELTNTNYPDFTTLTNSWENDKHNQNIISQVKALSEKYKKDIFVWEIGYMSVNGTNQSPWNFNLGKEAETSSALSGEEQIHAKPIIDEDEQSDCFKAFFTAVYSLPFIRGVSIWGENVGLPKSEKGYDFMQKKAVKVIKENFGK